MNAYIFSIAGAKKLDKASALNLIAVFEGIVLTSKETMTAYSPEMFLPNDKFNILLTRSSVPLMFSVVTAFALIPHSVTFFSAKKLFGMI